LRDLKLKDNTLFWYCSDNGGAAGPKSTGHLRGQKGTMWEGGLRVPGLVEWPARIPRPLVSDVPCCTLDMYPTLLAATGSVARNQIQPLDGLSLIPLFEGKMETRPRPIPFWARAANKGGHAVLLDWPYKLHLNPVGGRGNEKGEKPPATMLFDVSRDPKETTDVAAREPERVAKMKDQLQAWQDSVEKSLSGADYAATPKE
jgi:arylsulfatase A-like enzyme